MDKEIFGKRLSQFRISAGLSLKEFAEAVGISARMAVYYEKYAKRPPTEKLNTMAKVLKIPVNELLGLTSERKKTGAPKNAFLQKKLLIVEKFPKEDQKTILKMIDAITKANGIK